jgi:uncharacterized membrane protein YraQ (UPF0718 family)
MTWQSVIEFTGMALQSGWMGLLDYLAAHVLLCLVPAFIIAGYMSAMIPQEVVTRYLGPKASRWISYPAAAIGGSSWQCAPAPSCPCSPASGSAGQG